MNCSKIKFLITLIIVFSLSLQIIDANTIDNSQDLNNQGNLHSSSQITGKLQWLNNSGFESSESWYKILNTDELNPDVNASLYDGKANFEVLGMQETFTIQANFSQPDDWEAKLNPDFPIFPEWPDSMGGGGNDKYGIDSDGFWTQHQWTEGPRQTPSIHWVQVVSMPTNMRDYIITSANVSATVRGFVSMNIDVDHPYDYPDGDQDHDPQGVVYDNALFYVKIAKPNYDPSLDIPYLIAWNRTKYLGLYNSIEGLDERVMDNTYMNTIQEEDLIRFLTSVLTKDYKNFTIILGIDIFCEDNCASDRDEWISLCITSFSLNFTYKKKIDQFTSVSWNQDGKKLSELNTENHTVMATGANIKFKYKIDKNWTTTTSSINSEINIYLNANPHAIPIKCVDVNITDYEEANFWLTPPINNVNLSIQLLIKDTFNLNESITISIDNVTLDITYIIFEPDILIGDGGGTEDSSEVIQESGLNWIILGILMVVSAILIFLSLRTYVLIPRKHKKKSELILLTQKFKDINNIQAIVLIHKLSGTPIFTRSYSILEKEDNVLFSGFIQAIITIGQEIYEKRSNKDSSSNLKDKFESSISNIKTIMNKMIELDFRYFYCLIADSYYCRVVLILKEHPSDRLKNQLYDLLSLLDSHFSKYMKNFAGDLSLFNDNIPPIIDNYFALYYKEFFKLNHARISKIRHKMNLTNIEIHIIDAVNSNFNGIKEFKLDEILDLLRTKNRDLVIKGIENLMKQQIIIPFASK